MTTLAPVNAAQGYKLADGQFLSKEERLVIEGGKVKVVTQERQIAAKNQGGVIIDYLRFTCLRDRIVEHGYGPQSDDADTARLVRIFVKEKGLQPDTGADDLEICRRMAIKFAELLGYQLGEQRPGRDYYDHTYTVLNAFGQEIASVSGGGQSQRDTFCFTLKGEGCTFALTGWEKRVHDFFSELHPKVTRVDLAKDCFNRGQLTVDAAVAAFDDGAFSYRNRLPSYQQHGCWRPGDSHSRTFQVGKRESGKVCRIYEKDHQFGIMDGEWVRCEVELRSVNRIIPWDALMLPGQYFAGAYEFCNWLVHLSEPIPVKTSTKVGDASVEKAMRWVARVVAPTLVQITSAMPDFSWLEHLVIDNADRRIPRGLRGLDHKAVIDGMGKYFNRLNPNPGLASSVGL